MFDTRFISQKRNETARLIWIAPHRLSARIKVQTAVRRELTRADAFTRWWDSHASTKQRCEIQCEAPEFSDEHKWLWFKLV